MQTKSLGTGLALVIALTVMLSAVAMWYDTLKIHAEIKTGEVDVEFGRVSCVETPEAEGKDVGRCLVELKDIEDEGPADKDDLDLNITIINAYPGYSAMVCFEVVSSGTIPVVGPWPSFELPELPDWLVASHGIMPVQIDPGKKATFCFRLWVHEDLEAGIEPPEGYTYEFQVHMDFVQWNEAIYEVLELRLAKEFRYTDVDLKACPANLDGLLPKEDDYYIVYATVVKGVVKSVNPGALFGVIWITGVGVTEIGVVDKYDFHFDVEDGKDGKVRAYVYSATTGCMVRELKHTKDFRYVVDNKNNVVEVNIYLEEPLGPSQAVLIYLKFKPSDELIGSLWNTLDKYFENEAEIDTNIGSGSASATIKIVAKK